MALIVIRLHPVEPVNGGDFEVFLRDLVIEAFDIGIDNAPDGVSLGSASFVPPPVPPPPDPPTPWIPASTTKIVQHFELVSPTKPPEPLAVATAAIRVITPAGYTEHNQSDLRLKVTRGGKEILSSQLYYNVPVSASALPNDRGTLPKLSPTSLYLALPDPGREVDPADGFVPVSPDGTPPRYDVLLNAVNIVLNHDPGPGAAVQLADLTPTQARHVAYEIVWNQKYRPLPAPKKRTLAQMFTLPDSDDNGGDEAARGQFTGNLKAYYAGGDADAERLTGFVMALAAATYAAAQTTAAERVGFLLPVLPKATDTGSRFKSVRVILAGAVPPAAPAPVSNPFTVPAAYFYALGATVPPQIPREERYRLATLAEEQHTRRSLEAAVTGGVVRTDAQGDIDGVDIAQAARRLRSLGAVQGVAPVFAFNGAAADQTAVQALVAGWLVFKGEDISGFWSALTPPQTAGHFELVLRALTLDHAPLIAAIKAFPAAAAEEIHGRTSVQWLDLFGDPIKAALLPPFTQPGSPAERVAAFIRHVQKFFAVGPAGDQPDDLLASGPPHLRTPGSDPLTRFAERYRTDNAEDFVFGGVWDEAKVAAAVEAVLPRAEDAPAHDWLLQAVRVVDELTRLSAGADIPVELRVSVMERCTPGDSPTAARSV